MEKYKEFLLAIVAAVFGFFGSAGGVYVSNALSQVAETKKYDLVKRDELLTRRLDLLERVARIINRRGEARHLVAYLSIVTGLNFNNAVLRIPDNMSAENAAKYIDKVKELEALHSEFSTTMSLAAIHFGPNTRKLVQAVSTRQWWNTEDKQLTGLLDAMHSELSYPRRNGSESGA